MVEKLHKVENVAPIVEMTKGALYAACREKQFPHIRIGRRIRIPASALAQWIEEQTAKNTNAQNQDQSLTATA